MAKNPAARKHEKELRRRAALAERRKTEALTNSLSARVARAAHLPVQHCLVSENLLAMGMGYLVLARGPTSRDVTVSTFLLDTYCLGAKNGFVREMVGPEVDDYLDGLNASTPMVPIDPADAHKLLWDLIDWSRDLGFEPHKDVARATPLFGDIDPDSSTATFVFGKDGKPLYMPGPDDSPSVIRRAMERLAKAAGEGNFDYIVPLEGADGLLDLPDSDDDDDAPTIDGVVEPEPPDQLAITKEPAP